MKELSKDKLKQNLLDVAEFTFTNNELFNSYLLLQSAPVLIREEIQQTPLYKRIKARLDFIHKFQNGGRTGAGFVDPPDARERVIYKKLVEKIQGKGIRRMVDVGCYSGWVGRNLALEGIQVHGVDLDPQSIQQAKYMASGTLATFEVLEATQIGVKYQDRFDGAVAFDVIEHVFDPYVVRESLAKAVKKGGWVFVNLPKYDPEIDVTFEEYPDMNKEHIRIYTDDEVKRLYPNAEVEILRNEYGGLSYFITYQNG